MNKLADDIHSYWSGRAAGYSEYNRQEMADERQKLWETKLLSLVAERFPNRKAEEIRVLDAGCGPGFFSILLAKAGFLVTALDYTESMVNEAKANAGKLADEICWMTGDVQNLSLPNEAFDVVVTRNVTWNLPEPERAYSEWYRVLKKGGFLFNFDADWYGHLFDSEKRAAYEQDRKNVLAEGEQDYYGDTDNDAMEEIARQVPLSQKSRPKWDLETMKSCGFSDIDADESVWKEVWTEEEILNNASTPIFLISGQKRRKEYRLENAVVQPGTVWRGELSLAGDIKLPAMIFHGKRMGKTILVTAGVHAAEYVGIQSIIELSGALNINKICGTLVLIAAVNRPSFENRNGSFGLTDGVNLNRVFPGREDGSEMERLAFAVSSKLFKKADFYIDLHSGDFYEQLTPYVYYAANTDDQTAAIARDMAQQVDVPYMVRSFASGGAYNYAGTIGIPSILIERGQMGQWNEEETASTRRDVRNILCHLGIYAGEKDYRKYYPLDVTDLVYQCAAVSGLWYAKKLPGDLFEKGEILGEVTDYFGNVLETSTAEYDGVILYQTGSLQVVKEGPMITYGRINYAADERKERIVRYWGKRSENFLEQKRRELHSSMADRWLREINAFLPEKRPLKILDVGCGAGFFTVMLAKEGHEVTGIDLTPEMIRNAAVLAKEEGVSASFEVMDAEYPAYQDNAFDVIISRNLTWTLPHAEAAYRSWHRLLKNGGLLLNFDANYGKADFAEKKGLPISHTHHSISDEMLRESEELKRQMPISSYSRPAWDLETLGEIGFENFAFDLSLSDRIYPEIDEFYNPTPMFLIAAKKREK